MKKVLFFVLFFSLSIMGFSQQEARWLRNPAISPDGKAIVFGYMGNLYKVSAAGGVAYPITTGDDYCANPVWSHDGKTIAFMSNLNGNFDIFTMPVEGGVPVRITYCSDNDTPLDFTPDNQRVLFASGRYQPAELIRKPGEGFTNLYTVPAKGGREILVTAVGATTAKFNKEGTQIIYQDKKGYEDNHRKHHTSAVTRDIWIYDIASENYTQVSSFNGEDLSPVFSSDGKSFFYTSEQDGTLNIYQRTIGTNSEIKLTSFKDFPVRELSISDDNTLAFIWKGDIYTMKEGAQPTKIEVKVAANAGYQPIKNIPINSLKEFEVRPGGKEIAFVNRGEIFVSGIENSGTKRITDTPYQERMISWSKDGKYLYFSAEKDGIWGIYRTSLKNEDEKYFYASTMLNTEAVIVDSLNNYEPIISPDSKKMAYVQERNILKVYDIETKSSVTVLPEGINYSYSDGDWGFSWSPDSKWLLIDAQNGRCFQSNTALAKADGTGEIIYPIASGFGDYGAKFVLDGKAILYECTRDGLRAPSAQGGAESDLYMVFLDQEAYDVFNMNEDDYAVYKEKEDAAKAKKDSLDKVAAEKLSAKSKKSSKKKGVKDEVKRDEPIIEYDLNNLDVRKKRLTINSGRIGGYTMTKDASTLLYLRKDLNDWKLWKTNTRSGETKVLTSLGSNSGMELSEDESTLYLVNNGMPVSVSVGSGEVKPITAKGKMSLNLPQERDYIFHHIYGQVLKKFYDPKIHGVDWAMYRDEYAKFLPYINNNYDFQVLLSEFLGELNASHTGARYYSNSNPNGDVTASLGLLFDERHTGEGIKVSKVITGGIADKKKNKIKAGDIITAINSVEIPADSNIYKYLNNIIGENLILTVNSNGNIFTQEMKPTSERGVSALLYKEWIKKMENMVDSLSGGRLGYVHVEGMDESSYREVIDIALGKYFDKEALVVDTRFNGGGWLHDDLNTFLSGESYLGFAPQSNKIRSMESTSRWTKPSIVVMCEGNYSDAFIFPFVYKQNKIGKTVGMPVAGTGTAVWWEVLIDPSLIFGIPMIGTFGKDGVLTENVQLEPDIKVPFPYTDAMNGRDPQIEIAVKELLKELE